MVRDQLSDTLLGAQMKRASVRIEKISALHWDIYAAVHTPYLARFGQQIDISADGLRRDIILLCQLVYAHKARAVNMPHNVVLAFGIYNRICPAWVGFPGPNRTFVTFI